MEENPPKRSIGPWALLLTGLGSIVGSGWLFGAWRAAAIAGPAAIFAWIIGAFIVLAIALSYAELGAMFPETGGLVRYVRYSHGSLVGFMSAWANWMSLVAVVPIEAVASVQYMASWPVDWAQGLATGHELTNTGLLAASALVVVYFLLNYWGVKLFVKSSSAITIFKIAVPSLTAVALLHTSFHTQNFGANAAEFSPYGWSAVFTAVATSGILFTFNGFQTPVNLAGETRNPARSIPFALITSVLVTLVLYVTLQMAFIGAVDPASLIRGWHNLNFTSPFAHLALAVNLNWLAMLLYFDAFISPSGTGIINVATSSRIIMAMERNNTLPKIFGKLHPVYGAPRPAMWLNLVVCFTFLYCFRGWGAMAAIISVAVIVSYLVGPISAVSLRIRAPELRRPLRIPFLGVIAPFAFSCSSLVLYWAHWPLTGELILFMAAALPIYFYYQAKYGWLNFREDLGSALWMLTYFPTMAFISYIGGTDFGGKGWLDNGWDFAVVIAAALFFYGWGVRSGRRTPYLSEAAGAARVKEEESAESVPGFVIAK